MNRFDGNIFVELYSNIYKYNHGSSFYILNLMNGKLIIFKNDGEVRKYGKIVLA